jgi:hypothetical protein
MDYHYTITQNGTHDFPYVFPNFVNSSAQKSSRDLTPSALRGLRGVCARRAVLSQLAALRAWAAVVVLRRHEAWG